MGEGVYWRGGGGVCEVRGWGGTGGSSGGFQNDTYGFAKCSGFSQHVRKHAAKQSCSKTADAEASTSCLDAV